MERALSNAPDPPDGSRGPDPLLHARPRRTSSASDRRRPTDVSFARRMRKSRRTPVAPPRPLRELIAGLIPGYGPRQMTYDLRRLRRKGFIQRIPRSPRRQNKTGRYRGLKMTRPWTLQPPSGASRHQNHHRLGLRSRAGRCLVLVVLGFGRCCCGLRSLRRRILRRIQIAVSDQRPTRIPSRAAAAMCRRRTAASSDRGWRRGRRCPSRRR
jgi:hypothetical protein